VEQRGLAQDPLAEDFDSIEYPEPVTDAGDTHFLESLLVEIQEDIPANIVGTEGVLVASALYIMQPMGNVVVSPCAQEGGIGHALGWVCRDVLLVPDGLERHPDIVGEHCNNY
jgi:hypothetical protein